MCHCVYVDSRICNPTQAFGSRIVTVHQAPALQFLVHVKDVSFCEWHDVFCCTCPTQVVILNTTKRTMALPPWSQRPQLSKWWLRRGHPKGFDRINICDPFCASFLAFAEFFQHLLDSSELKSTSALSEETKSSVSAACFYSIRIQNLKSEILDSKYYSWCISSDVSNL